MKHTDLNDVKGTVTEKLSNLVKSCSFEYKNWSQVQEHPFFKVSMNNAYIVMKKKQTVVQEVIQESPQNLIDDDQLFMTAQEELQ